jgi:hypothetical protein
MNSHTEKVSGIVGMQNTVAIRFIANFGEASNNTAANASQAAFWLYKPRRHVRGVEV